MAKCPELTLDDLSEETSNELQLIIIDENHNNIIELNYYTCDCYFQQQSSETHKEKRRRKKSIPMENSSKLFANTSKWMSTSTEENILWNSTLLYGTNVTNFYESSNTTTKGSCGEWESAQHSTFQFASLCFLAAFAIPRQYKTSILFFRILLTISFIMSGAWAQLHVCAYDWVFWSISLALVNGVHVAFLIYKFLPPAISLELTELYTKVFKPLKVSKKHFRELTREATLLSLLPGETYANEDDTSADDKLSILLKGRLKVTCNGTFLHGVSSFQFIDSPEWKMHTTANGIRFQVTISAEEESLYLCWSRMKLDRTLKHRTQLAFVLSCIIGKDITHKMYSLNEEIGHINTNTALSLAAKDDHWRKAMNRSVSVDAVNTGTKGHVRSNTWKQVEQNRQGSIFSECGSPSPGQQQCWMPVIAKQFLAESPFVKQDESTDSQDDEREPMLPPTLPDTNSENLQLSILPPNFPIIPPISLVDFTSNSSVITTQAVALIPVILPVVTSPTIASVNNSSHNRKLSNKRQRGVKFDETRL